MKHRFRYIVHGVTPDDVITLSDEDAHHLVRVVRRGVGDPLEILDENGRVWDATVTETSPFVRVRVGPAPRRALRRPDLELAVGLAEWGRLDLVVEKATEIGVRRIVIVRTERAGRIPDAAAFAKRRERMDRVAEAALRQSGHSLAPVVDGIVDLAAVLTAEDDRRVIVVDPRGSSSLGDLCRSAGGGPLRLVVGPDAGFSEREIASAVAAGCGIARLGEGILRAETAALMSAAIAADALSWGLTGDDGASG